MKQLFSTLILSAAAVAFAQSAPGATYWQQHVDYHIQVELDDKNDRLDGNWKLVYTNNSPDVIDEVFIHLYWNAFQPGSMMSNMAQIPNRFKDNAIGERIERLKPEEQGGQTVLAMQQDGVDLAWQVSHTVLHAALAKPLDPGQSTTLTMKYVTNIPIVIERAGRDNPEGVDYSFTQWYPKIAVYDEQGWHPDIYVAREFYGDFGHFRVDITAPSKYTIGGTGTLQNPEEIGKGYSEKPVKHKRRSQLTWVFEADNVHDFAWAADPDYIHEMWEAEGAPRMHLFYQDDKKSRQYMAQVKEDLPEYFRFMSSRFGTYDWPEFSVIQGGEGAMEYPMATIMECHSKSYEGLMGTVMHEASHMWFYGMLGVDEQRYHWIDEGFTSYAQGEASNVILAEQSVLNPHKGYLSVYGRLAGTEVLEPMATMANYYDGKRPYQFSAYMWGSNFLSTLRGIVGEEAFWATMQRFMDEWRFKHPTPENFIRAAEVESGMVLDWFLNQYSVTSKVADVGIDSVWAYGPDLTKVRLSRPSSSLALPVDLRVTYANGNTQDITIPLAQMFGHKGGEHLAVMGPWNYTELTFELDLLGGPDEILSIQIDPEGFMVDANPDNNHWPRKEATPRVE